MGLVGYLGEINSFIGGVKDFLNAKGIQEKFLDFGGPLPALERIFVPTDVRSEFLANRAMGDWAEQTLSKAFDSLSVGNLKPVHYGDSESLSAGDPNFKERYISGLEETRAMGKRPDLLLVPKGLSVEEDISKWPRQEADEIARKAKAAIEVRSSKQQALKYMKIKAAETGKAGKSGLSFTVKVEDLRIVYRWIEVCETPQYYFQVFFDSVFAIDVLDIFRLIANRDGITIDKPDKSQNKSTIMIPIAFGLQVGEFIDPPTFEVEIRENRLGRIDPYVIPVGGNLKLDDDQVTKLFRF